MKKALSKLLLLVLAVCMLSAVAVGCKNDKNDGGTTTGGDTTVGSADTQLQSSLPAVDYEGYAFIFADTELESGGRYVHVYEEIFAESGSNEAISEAVYKRNGIIQEKYNVELISNKDINLYTALNAQEDICDAVIYGPYAVKSCMEEGLLLNLNEYDDIFNFDESWWMGGIMNEIAFGDKLYIMAGDANIRALASVNALFYNKSLAEEYCGNPDIYGIVDKGEWTYELMNQYAKAVGGEANGDNVLDQNDRYGHAGNNFASIAFFYGLGCRFITKDQDGEIVKNFGDEKQIEVLTDLVELINDTTMYFNGENYAHLMDNGRSLVPQQVFADGRALFTHDLVARGTLMREIEQEYGILPIPKYDTAQEDYISYLHGNSSFFSIPITVTNAERSATILEDMTFFSTNTIRNAYIEVMLKSKVAQANENDIRMVDIVYRNVTFDMAYYGIGSIDSNIRDMVNRNDTNFVSFFQSNKTTWERMLDNYLRPYLEGNN